MDSDREVVRVVLVYGASGWVGGKMVDLLKGVSSSEVEQMQVVAGLARLENRAQVEEEMRNWHNPPRSILWRVINCAGKTGRPNVDWCETHKDETLQSNVIGALNVASLCASLGVHLTYFSTGCLYTYSTTFPTPHPTECPLPSVRGVTEEDSPNFQGSFYSYSKAVTEGLLQHYPSCLILRLRMPLSDDLHERSLLTKLIGYERVVDVPNSMSVLTDLLPLAVDLCAKGRTGIYNFTNPGCVSHNFLLQLYQDLIDPSFTWQNFTEEEQARILIAPRSNTFLDVTKLLAEYPDLPPIDQALRALFQRMKSERS